MQYSACLSPIIIRNKYDKKLYRVPCGKCDACLINRGLSQSTKLDREGENWQDCIFFTLTYNNTFLPVAKALEHFVYHPYDLGKCTNISAYLPDYFCDRLYIDNAIREYGGLPVLCHTDFTNFKKEIDLHAFSHHITICGEYGPERYRPHAHGILFFNPKGISREISVDTVSNYIAQAWTSVLRGDKSSQPQELGFIDVQLVTGKANQYVTGYMFANSNLPKILRDVFPPKKVQSRTNHVNVRISAASLRETLYTGNFINNSEYVESVSNPLDIGFYDAIFGKLFPSLRGFNRFAHGDLLSVVAVVNTFTLREFVDYYNDLSFATPDKQLLWQLFDDNKATEDNVSNFYFVCRKICRLCKDFHISLDFYFDRYVMLRSHVELFKLKNFYELQEQITLDPLVENEWINGLYYLDDLSKLPYPSADPKYCHFELCPLFKTYELKAKKILLDSTKTKKANDIMAVHHKSRYTNNLIF